MKRQLLFAAMTVMTLSIASCGPETAKSLVLYYSQTGATEAVAQEIQSLLGADIESLELQDPYSGTYGETIARVSEERANGTLPEVLPLKSDLSKYDVIFLGYPIWFGTYAPPISSLVKDYDFAGKKIVTFCTFGSGGLEPAAKDLTAALPKATIADNHFGIRNARIKAAAKEVRRFLIENGYAEGELEALPGYSEMRPVTEEEKQIFDAACGNYQFPLGTPVLAGKRGTSEGVDYIYEVDSNGATTTIYVTVPEGSAPEFTRVVR